MTIFQDYCEGKITMAEAVHEHRLETGFDALHMLRRAARYCCECFNENNANRGSYLVSHDWADAARILTAHADALNKELWSRD